MLAQRGSVRSRANGRDLESLNLQTAGPVPRLEDWRRQALAGVKQARQIRALDEQEAMPVGEGAS